MQSKLVEMQKGRSLHHLKLAQKKNWKLWEVIVSYAAGRVNWRHAGPQNVRPHLRTCIWF